MPVSQRWNGSVVPCSWLFNSGGSTAACVLSSCRPCHKRERGGGTFHAGGVDAALVLENVPNRKMTVSIEFALARSFRA